MAAAGEADGRRRTRKENENDTSDTRAAGDMFQGKLDDIMVNEFIPEGVLDISDLASAGWTKTGGSDVPEPTSGLLLLVGGAMLALRRKRA